MPDGLTYHADTRIMHQMIAAFPQKANAFLRGVAQEITNDVKLSMGTSPPGRSYSRGSRSHTASRPGYPPTPDTGALRASIRWEQQGQLVMHIMDGVEYGIHLEFGTSRLAARPFMRPAVEAWNGERFIQTARQARLLEP